MLFRAQKRTIVKLNYTAIYLLIARTYTPICIQFLTGVWHWGILAVIWSMAVIGIVVKMFVIHASPWITAALYLLTGWLSLLAIPEVSRCMPLQFDVVLFLRSCHGREHRS